MVKVMIEMHPLKALRKERGLSVAKLAQMSGVSVPTIWRYEAGNDIYLSNALDIAQALGVDLIDVVNHDSNA